MYRTNRPRTRISASALFATGFACAFALAAMGCSSDHSVAPIAIPPLPGNTAPDSTALRLMAAYSHGLPAEYDTLLTSDFHYHFSAQTDPILVSEFGTTLWGKVNEVQSFAHLTHGFTNGQGMYVPKASSITYSAINTFVGNDSAHADSTTWYQTVTISPLQINIDVPTSGGTTTYNISSFIVFLVVRGDAAVLSAGQSHSSSRWYIREMDDFTPAFYSKGPHTMPANTVTWGKVRALYFQ